MPPDTVTLRPTGDGALLECIVYPATPTTHYDKVDEDPPNDGIDYVRSDGAGIFRRDTFTKPASGIPAGSTITKVTIYNRVRAVPLEWLTPLAGTLLRNSAGALAYGVYGDYDVWTTISTEYTTSPFTGVAWTIEEVDGLQIGTSVRGAYDPELGYTYAYCSTVWLVVEYTPPVVKQPLGDGITFVY